MTPVARFALAPLRCLALVALAVAACTAAMFSVILLALIVTIPLLYAIHRRFGGWGRRLARDWGGVAIAAGYRPAPGPPPQRADGWYVHDNQLYRSPRVPQFLRTVEVYSKDPTYVRDWLWMALTPFTGGLAAALPLAMLAGGVASVAGAWSAVNPLVGAAFVLAGLAIGPAMLSVHARWTRVLLQPVEDAWWRRSGFGPWLGRRMKDTWHGGGLAGMALGSVGFLAVQVVGSVVSWGGLYPQAAAFTRPYLGYYRRRAAQWAGVGFPVPYRPLPAPPQPDETGRYRAGRSLYETREGAIRHQRGLTIFKDPATWRDLLWMVTAPFLSLINLVPAVLVSIGLYGLLWQPLSWFAWAVPTGLASGHWVTPWYMWYAVTSVEPGLAVIPGWVSPFIGVALGLLGILIAGPLFRWRIAFDGRLLTPTRATQLAQRVQHLTETRSDALDAQAAELRRIERDLHDGAQARLVAVGLSLATVEQLMETDPVAARVVLAQARDTSSTALSELRNLVRGIHPPVLAERGLGDAIRAIALDTPLPVEVTIRLDGRAEAPVEAAAYFATCEALTNAVRHSGATRVSIDITHARDRLCIRVVDDGRGGADPARGSGLRGVQRRLGTFDGILRVDSPAGGPTTVSLEIPCELSSVAQSGELS